MTIIKVGKLKLNLIDSEFATLEEIDARLDTKERKLLSYVRDYSPLEYPSIIEQEKDYYFLDALSPIRENAVRWLPIEEEDEVLELDSITGAITSGLLKMSDNLTVHEKSATNARILAERFADCNKLTIYCGIVNDKLTKAISSNTYDWIIIKDLEHLSVCEKLLKPGGHIVFMGDNRYGIRYISGCRIPGNDSYFSGITDKKSDACSLAKIEKTISENGFEEWGMYYPYPDFRFMKDMYSDRRLPLTGELTLNNSNYDSDRLELFSEKDAFETAIAEGNFPQFANSYLCVIGPKLQTEYARFSNDRSDEHTIFTTIDRKESGRVVRKHPLSKVSEKHISNIYDYYRKLNERYIGTDLQINLCTLVEKNNHPVASFEYIEGRVLSELMDECLFSDNLNGFYELFDRYVKLIGYGEGVPISDLDIVFSNIMVGKDKWTLIDYEWCKESAILTRELAYRAVYCYILEDPRRKKINLDLIREKLGLSKAASDEIEADEVLFQKYVTGKNKSIAEIREMMGRKSVNPVPMAELLNKDDSVFVYQVYMADGTGQFSEQNSYYLKDAYRTNEITESVITVNPGDVSVRIDPINAASIVRVMECRINELDYPIENKKYLGCNGRRLNEDSFVFDTNDPNLIFCLNGLVHEENSFLYLKLKITCIDDSVAKALCEKPKFTDYLRK